MTLLTTFVIIPLAFFFQKNETASSGRYICNTSLVENLKYWLNVLLSRSRQTVLPALGYTGLFAMIIVGLFGIGGVVPSRDLPVSNSTAAEQFRNVIEELNTSGN